MSITVAATVVPIAVAMVVALAGFVALLPLLGVSVATITGNRGVDEASEHVPELVPALVPDLLPDISPPAKAMSWTTPVAAPFSPSVEPVMDPVPDRDRATGPGRSIRIAFAATVLVAALVPVVAPTRKHGRSRTSVGQATGDSE